MVIGTEGRLENFGDSEEAEVRVWNRRSDYRAEADLVVPVHTPPGTHGGADPVLVHEFLQFVRKGGATVTATMSLRDGGRAIDVAPVDPELAAYFTHGQK
jgi:hypothetical protein